MGVYTGAPFWHLQPFSWQRGVPLGGHAPRAQIVFAAKSLGVAHSLAIGIARAAARGCGTAYVTLWWLR